MSAESVREMQEMREMVTQLIAEHGRPVTLVGPEEELDNSQKPWRGPTKSSTEDSAVTISATAVFSRNNEAGDPRRGIQQCQISAEAIADVDLTTYWTVRDGDTIWRITAVDIVQPGAQRIVYTLDLAQ